MLKIEMGIHRLANPELQRHHFHAIMSDLERNQNRELAMTAYVPALTWFISNVVCLIIAKRRDVEPTAIRAMSVALLGPIAIPFVLAAKPVKFRQS